MDRLDGMAKAGGGFNPLAAGNKTYGTGRTAPTSGAVDKQGYAERDRRHAARNAALLAQSGTRNGLASRIGAV